MFNIDKNIFATNLRLTQEYCEIQKSHTEKNHTSIFRSYNPVINGDNIFKFKISDYGHEENVRFYFVTDWSIDPFEKGNEYLFNELFEKQIKYKKSNIANSDNDTVFVGEILVTEVDNTVIDGASASCSCGLIDDYDCPPIDTWFYKTKSSNGLLLFAWIPHEFVAVANDGVLVNAVECIDWFKNWLPTEYKLMKEYLSIGFD